ncbi:MAG: autotransporter-associated beta strand repeat-containing protein, partial [Spartobacteria bacterium]
MTFLSSRFERSFERRVESEMRSPRWSALLAAYFAVGATAFAATVTITPQTGNFSSQQSSGGGSKGTYNNNATEVGMYANGAADASHAAFQTLTTTGPGSGTARTLRHGDEFKLTVYSGISPGNRLGMVLRSSTTYSSFSSIDANNEVKLQIGNSGGYKLFDSNFTTGDDSNLGAGADVSFTIKITSPSTYNATVTRSGSTKTWYDRPWSGTAISSWGIFYVNDGGSNDSFWKSGSVQDTSNLEIGYSGGDVTINGVIADSLPANNTSGTTANKLYKGGAGVLTLGGANTYTGLTQIENGTLSISSDGNLGGVPASTTAGSLVIYSTGTLRSTANMTLDAKRGIELGTVAGPSIEVNSSTTLTYGGIMANTAQWNKKGAGTLALTSATAGSGVHAVAVQAGTLQINGDAALGAAPGAPTTNVDIWSTGTFEANGTFTLSANRRIELGTVTGPRVSVTSGSTLTYAGQISGSAGWSKEGAGTLALTGPSTFTGALTINSGVVNAQNATALGSTAGSTTVATNAALQIQGGITVTGEVLNISGFGYGSPSTGALRSISGTNEWAGVITLGANTRFASDSGLLIISGNITNAGYQTIVQGSGNTTISGIISGTGSTLTSS